MLIGVLFTFSSALSLNNTALSSETIDTLYRFNEANLFVGVAFFMVGLMGLLTPIFAGWYLACSNRYMDNESLGANQDQETVTE